MQVNGDITGGLKPRHQIEAIIDDKRLAGLVVGREVTSGRFTVEDAQALLKGAAKDLGPWSLEQLEDESAVYSQVLTDGGDPDAAMTLMHIERFHSWLSGGTP